eukprot:8819942-Alexandrium_andersonii.AAC.1
MARAAAESAHRRLRMSMPKNFRTSPANIISAAVVVMAYHSASQLLWASTGCVQEKVSSTKPETMSAPPP